VICKSPGTALPFSRCRISKTTTYKIVPPEMPEKMGAVVDAINGA
jgi:hypothetical protein